MSVGMAVRRRWSPLKLASISVRSVAAAIAISRLVGAANPAPPIAAAASSNTTISVIVPARNESRRFGPLLDAVVGSPGVVEVIVVDDQSSDATSAVAAQAGAKVVAGAPLPHGWAGKAWALQQGIEASVAEWVVTLDADTRPDPRLPAALVARGERDGFDLLTVGGRFECPTPASRWLHASMLTTLVYRFGPPGVDAPPDRIMANGQCMTLRREPFLGSGGMAPVGGEVVEDVALARHLAATGRTVGFLDASDLLTVRMFESIGETWSGWGRSLALPGVEPRRRQIRDLAIVVLAQALPLPRLLFGRGDLLDVALLATRLGTLVGTRAAYERRDLAYWLSPLADLASAVAIAGGIRRGRAQTWRGRTYS